MHNFYVQDLDIERIQVLKTKMPTETRMIEKKKMINKIFSMELLNNYYYYIFLQETKQRQFPNVHSWHSLVVRFRRE